MIKTGVEVLVENDCFIAINKPARLLSIPDREGKDISLKKILEEQYGKGNIFTVHRLDRDTSGVIVFAKDEATHKQLSALFEGRDVEKYYVGLVQGTPFSDKGSIEEPIMEHPGKITKMMTHQKGKPSHTEYEVLEKFRRYTLMRFQIHTGRTHQIRVHMQHMGNSIVCDELYGSAEPIFISALKNNYHLSKKEDAERPILSRLALHSQQLKFTFNDVEYNIEAPLPKDLRALLQQMRKLKA
ncbi:RluA family pseudouridine synthase [Deminuibacter soli]|uniref:RNA pseudouridine synthase n=1 Tax=Deminuibacter soli TaxID=2291815 RepID=A0A3E1NNY9_9BACT|nr:RNA pseudouridine synthase [Deminuibacter soli]RFM29630.1 RNA pseudouridine synthase [Deminuibacter soli]